MCGSFKAPAPLYIRVEPNRIVRGLTKTDIRVAPCGRVGEKQSTVRKGGASLDQEAGGERGDDRDAVIDVGSPWPAASGPVAPPP